jgi:hypothetical protein
MMNPEFIPVVVKSFSGKEIEPISIMNPIDLDRLVVPEWADFFRFDIDDNIVNIKLRNFPYVREWFNHKESEFKEDWRRKGIQLCLTPYVIVELLKSNHIIEREIIPFTYDFNHSLVVKKKGEFVVRIRVVFFNKNKDDFEFSKLLLSHSGIVNKKFHHYSRKELWDHGCFPMLSGKFVMFCERSINSLMGLLS